MDHRIGLLSFVLGTAILLLSACGTPLPTTPGTVYANTYAKLTANNTWTWNASTATTIGGAPQPTSIGTITDLYGIQVASGTQITKSYTASGALIPVATTEYIRFSFSGDLVREDASGVVTTILPASFAVGTTYTMLSNASGTNITGTVIAIGSTATVAAGTFMDVVKINISGAVNLGTAIGTASGSMYISQSAANMIYFNRVDTYGGGTTIVTDIRELQPGYTAL